MGSQLTEFKPELLDKKINMIKTLIAFCIILQISTAFLVLPYYSKNTSPEPTESSAESHQLIKKILTKREDSVSETLKRNRRYTPFGFQKPFDSQTFEVN